VRYPELKRITWHFFASNHGKWIYDGMAAVVKRRCFVLARRYRTAICDPADVANAANTLNNVRGYSFAALDTSHQTRVTGLDGIRGFHKFEAGDLPSTHTREKSGKPSIVAWTTSFDSEPAGTFALTVTSSSRVGAVNHYSGLELAMEVSKDVLQQKKAEAEAEIAAKQSEAKPDRAAQAVQRLAAAYKVGTIFKVAEEYVAKTGKPRHWWKTAKVVSFRLIDSSATGDAAEIRYRLCHDDGEVPEDGTIAILRVSRSPQLRSAQLKAK
jgi:hypothetical protein